MNKNKKCVVCGEFNPNTLSKTCSYKCAKIREMKKQITKGKNHNIRQISIKNKNTPAKFTTQTKGEMLKRDGSCIICRSRNNIEYHHCYYGGQAEYGEDRNDLDKGVCLCHKCHHEIHHGNGIIGQDLRQKCKDYLKKV